MSIYIGWWIVPVLVMVISFLVAIYLDKAYNDELGGVLLLVIVSIVSVGYCLSHWID